MAEKTTSSSDSSDPHHHRRRHPSDSLRPVAAFLGATGVALGAFGAHGGKHKLTGPKLDHWKTAVLYQLVHAVAILAVSVAVPPSGEDRRHLPPPETATTANHNDTSLLHRAGQCMALGSFLFSGSVYMLCLDLGPKKVWGPTTPIGGLLMIAGWTLLGLSTSTTTIPNHNTSTISIHKGVSK